MIATREKQKAEAVKWLELMGVREDVRRKFEEDGTVMLCDNEQYFPVEDWMAREIERAERQLGVVVYLVVRKLTVFGTLDALLYVGKYDEEWKTDRRNIKRGYAMSCCINRDDPDLSELGSISFRMTSDGAIVREG